MYSFRLNSSPALNLNKLSNFQTGSNGQGAGNSTKNRLAIIAMTEQAMSEDRGKTACLRYGRLHFQTGGSRHPIRQTPLLVRKN
jgi:hypothetical protein